MLLVGGDGALGVWDWELLITARYQAPYTLPEKGGMDWHVYGRVHDCTLSYT